MHFFPSSQAIKKFLQTHTPQYLQPYSHCQTQAERFDFARLIILYTLGGISVDISVARPLERFDALLQDVNPHKNMQQFIVALDYNFETEHDSKVWAYPRRRGIATHCLVVTPRHPTLKRVLDRVSWNLMHRDQTDEEILAHGYPPEVLEDARKSALLRRTWTTGSGPLSEEIFLAVEEQNRRARGDPVDAKNETEATLSTNAEVIVLPRETFMSAHPGGMRFRSLQQQDPRLVAQSLYLGSLPLSPESESLRRRTYIVYDESHLETDSRHSVAPFTYLIGAVRDASHIAETPFRYIVELSCFHGVHVHMVVGGGVEECRARFAEAVQALGFEEDASRHKCGRFELLGEPADLQSLENRVDRIAYLRDFQREHLRVVLENGHEDDVIVVADLDLHALPPVKKLMHEVNRMRRLHEYDVLCSNGLMHRPNGYYDLYATVLLPDTFLYPVRHRLLKKSWEGEDLNIVRSHDEFGEVTSWDVLDWIEEEGQKRRRDGLDTVVRRRRRKVGGLTSQSEHGGVGQGYVDEDERNVLWEKVLAMRGVTQLVSARETNPQENTLDKNTDTSGQETTNANILEPSAAIQDQIQSWYHAYENYEEYGFGPSTAVPVRSCFGGLTIYSATALLEPSCRYHPPTVGEEASRLLKYANLDDKRPCEHVVFHDCLFRLHQKRSRGMDSASSSASRIAIQPDMRTMWNDTPPPRSKLISDSNQDSLITFFKQGDRGDRLTSLNRLHSLRMNAEGFLVIESCPATTATPDATLSEKTDSTSSSLLDGQVFTSGTNSKGLKEEELIHAEGSLCKDPMTRFVSSFMAPDVSNREDKPTNETMSKRATLARTKENWTHMFLILERDGNLIQLKQVPRRRLKDGGGSCGPAQDESCQLQVWSSNTSQWRRGGGSGRGGIMGGLGWAKSSCDGSVGDERRLTRYQLELTNEGYLELSEWKEVNEKENGTSKRRSEDILWRTNGVEESKLH